MWVTCQFFVNRKKQKLERDRDIGGDSTKDPSFSVSPLS